MKSSKFKHLTLVAFSAILCVSLNANANTKKTYELRGEPRAGTLIRTVEATSPISFRKSFAELTAEEQELFKAKYDDIGYLDTPPFPNLGLRTVFRPIINANKKLNATGSLHLTATVNANGFVESVEVVSSPNVELAAAAEKTLLATRFDPATCNGIACEMTFPLEITFK